MRKDMRDDPEWAMELGAARRALRDFPTPKGIDPTPIRLQAIRQVYEVAAASGQPPAQAVADGMGVSIATAGRWIRRSKTELGWG